jgi:ATP-independent RNA helicase DbpA
MSGRFDSLALSAPLLAVVAEIGYEQLTPIQAEAIPLLLAGRDLVGQSKTGSGKTTAFALPILQKLDLSRRDVQALVLCPTRELAAQVAREIRKLGRKHPGLQVLGLWGGEPGRPQAEALARGVHIAVGTPGRVLDHLKRERLDLRRVGTVVLDEADRMLDMGFADEMDQIIRVLPPKRQTVLFSATFPASIEQMSRAHQHHAARVTIDDAHDAPAEIRQLAVVAEPQDKLRALHRILDEHPHESALVFCNLKATVADLVRTLSAAGVSADALHGDLEQYDRDRVMAMFRNLSVRVVIATDVAARGIDVVGLDMVVNYDLPPQPDVYVHRIGRTGRAGQTGLAVTLVTSRQRPKLTALEEVTGARIETKSVAAADAGQDAAVVARLRRPAAMDTILISGGRKDKVRPGDILGALTGEAGGLQASDVGKIEIHDRLAYVAVARQHSRTAVQSLNRGRIKGRRFRASLLTAG